MIAEEYEAFLIDLDGVVYVGDDPIPSAVATMRRLRDRGKAVRFLTNNSRRPRTEIAAQLRDDGVPADAEDVVSSGYATGIVLREHGHDSVFVVGTDGLGWELRDQGFDLETDDPDAVVVGLDSETTYRDIELGARAVRNGAAFVAANVDPRLPTSEGIAPGTGAIAKAIEVVAEAEPTVAGKPEPLMFERALESVGETNAVMIGDSLQSDVAGAERAGIPSVLVTGHGVDSVPADDASPQPDHVVTDLADLFEPT